jgi:hypothetical protein
LLQHAEEHLGAASPYATQAQAVRPGLLTLALAFALLILPAAFAAPPSFSDDYPCVFSFASPSQMPPDSVIYAQYIGAHGNNRSTAIVAREGSGATLYADSPAIEVALKYDDPATPTPDGIWNGVASCNGRSQAIPLHFVGDISGTLFYQNGSVASGVQVEIACSGAYARSATASEAGSFYFGGVPEGKCALSAKDGPEAAHLAVDVGRGDFKEAQLRLSKPDITPLLLAVGAIMAFAAAVAYFLFFGGKGKQGGAAARQKGAKLPPAQPPNVATKRQLDLIATLDEKEKKIMEYVQHHAPSSVRVSRLRRDLLIPKPSLTRTLQSLERKQFLKIGKVGARTYAELHEFYRKAE